MYAASSRFGSRTEVSAASFESAACNLSAVASSLSRSRSQTQRTPCTSIWLRCASDSSINQNVLDIASTLAILRRMAERLATLLLDSRKRSGLTLRAVQARTGVSNAYLSQLETGKIKEPSPSVLHKLSQLYGLSYSDMLAAAGYPLPGKNSQSVSLLAARIGPTSQEEEDAIVDYLRFLRSQSGRRGK